MDVTRRQFLGSSAAAVIAAGGITRGKVFGANDKIRVACVGIHGQGKTHIEQFIKAGAEVVALCDVDRTVLESRAAKVKADTGKKPKLYTDVRDLVENDGIDVVSTATPNHWHSLVTILACQAGKDVYVEKPISHNIWEGRQVVAAAQKYGRVVQHGTQNRSNAKWMRAIQRMREGVIGDIFMARALCYKRRDAIEPIEPPKPKRFNWNLWQGPAQEREFRPIYVHYNWHWFWEWGNGDLGNQGVHQMDCVVWGMNKGLPVKVYSTGGRYGYKDEGETANTQVCTYTYADGTVTVFEVRGRGTNDEAGTKVGNLFYGSKGYFSEADGKLKFYDLEGKEIPDTTTEMPATDGAYGNFLKAVRSRKPEDIPAPALAGHLAAAHCHLGNTSYRLGRSLQFDPEKEMFVGDDEANQMLKRNYRKEFEVPQLA
ncbi:MAG: Gfo/Idh/MocA family oxidoreductase [Candidatus Hydrogenedentes bacterium]|nr:Gfo/Idh/MocA family oxidoreductase [Candidatus Hydrogenedentota bacterium]